MNRLGCLLGTYLPERTPGIQAYYAAYFCQVVHVACLKGGKMDHVEGQSAVETGRVIHPRFTGAADLVFFDQPFEQTVTVLIAMF